ncbi:MAG: DUF308 domain-containing protein [bacterium]|nr:DUF308 domain-containing protein [bacterium]
MSSEGHPRAAKMVKQAKKQVESKLGKIWWAILLRGILAIALAACAFIWPDKTISILVKLLGAYFLIDGIVGAIAAYRGKGGITQLTPAVVSLALGLVLLLWTGVSAKLFLILVGVWLIVQGVGLFIDAWKTRSGAPERGLTMWIAVAVVIIGLVFVFWTDTGLVSISWLIGLGAAILGCLLIFLATRIRTLRQHVQNLGSMSDE